MIQRLINAPLVSVFSSIALTVSGVSGKCARLYNLVSDIGILIALFGCLRPDVAYDFLATVDVGSDVSARCYPDDHAIRIESSAVVEWTRQRLEYQNNSHLFL